MSNLRVPQKLHSIWLGSILDEKGRGNIKAWREKNPEYEMNLWIDSALYPKIPLAPKKLLSSSDEKIQQSMQDKYVKSLKAYQEKLLEYKSFVHNFSEFSKWTTANNIIIRDIHKDNSAIYNQMESKQFYDDEIIGKYPNYAAASDILRTEILYRQGGIYFDCKDVFPGDSPLNTLEPPFGFFCNKRIRINNDILVSIPAGTIISNYREIIHKNYTRLYQDERTLRAHRNPIHRKPGKDYRLTSTLITSGPDALSTLLFHDLQNKEISEAKQFLKIEKQAALGMPKKYFKLPQENEYSWRMDETERNFDKTKEVFRSYLHSFFVQQLAFYATEEKEFAPLKKLFPEGLQNSDILIELNDLRRDAGAERKLTDNIKILAQLAQLIDSNPLSKISILQLAEKCRLLISKVNDDSRLKLNLIDFVEKVQGYSNLAENKLLPHLESNYSPKAVINAMDTLYENDNIPPGKANLFASFVEELMETKSSEPNFSLLGKFKFESCLLTELSLEEYKNYQPYPNEYIMVYSNEQWQLYQVDSNLVTKDITSNFIESLEKLPPLAELDDSNKDFLRNNIKDSLRESYEPKKKI